MKALNKEPKKIQLSFHRKKKKKSVENNTIQQETETKTQIFMVFNKKVKIPKLTLRKEAQREKIVFHRYHNFTR